MTLPILAQQHIAPSLPPQSGPPVLVPSFSTQVRRCFTLRKDANADEHDPSTLLDTNAKKVMIHNDKIFYVHSLCSSLSFQKSPTEETPLKKIPFR